MHQYTDADMTVAPRVNVTYRARFRVDSGDWQDIPERITITGPTTSLAIIEGTPVLTGG